MRSCYFSLYFCWIIPEGRWMRDFYLNKHHTESHALNLVLMESQTSSLSTPPLFLLIVNSCIIFSSLNCVAFWISLACSYLCFQWTLIANVSNIVYFFPFLLSCIFCGTSHLIVIHKFHDTLSQVIHQGIESGQCDGGLLKHSLKHLPTTGLNTTFACDFCAFSASPTSESLN